MDAQFWHDRWQRNEIGFHQAEINSHLQEFWPQLGLAPGSRVFVPLCGKSRDLLWLRARGFEVVGIEISPIAVRDFFRENDLTPRRTQRGPFELCEADGLSILCGDFFALTADWVSDVRGVYDRASLIALPPDMRPRYAQHMATILPPTAAVLLVTMEYPAGAMQGPPFAVDAAEVRRLYAARFQVRHLLRKDILAENPQFRERGLASLHEQVYRLEPIPA
jgi:thiopurine S-methyltransferase